MKKIWITWECQRRNRELSDALDADFYELAEIDQIKSPLKKYLLGLWKTTRIIRSEKPDVVFCQNPSIVLSLYIVLSKRIFGYRACVDAHNAGIFPAEGASKILLSVANFIQRYADLTIITNSNLCAHVERNGGNGIVLPDRIPSIKKTEPCSLRGRINILFICTYAADEPYNEVFRAAVDLPKDIFIYVTGNYKKKNINPKDVPPNIVLTGFVPEEEYLKLLNSVDATIDLTTREDCLVCGAYETVAVEKVLILSDTQALRSYFYKGAVYADNTASGIKRAIEILEEDKERLLTEVRQLKDNLTIEWENSRNSINSRISSWFVRA